MDCPERDLIVALAACSADICALAPLFLSVPPPLISQPARGKGARLVSLAACLCQMRDIVAGRRL